MYEGLKTIPSQLNATLKFIKLNGNSVVGLLDQAKPGTLSTNHNGSLD
jgi:hypothetical protein